jgi:hypothetical protein
LYELLFFFALEQSLQVKETITQQQLTNLVESIRLNEDFGVFFSRNSFFRKTS